MIFNTGPRLWSPKQETDPASSSEGEGPTLCFLTLALALA